MRRLEFRADQEHVHAHAHLAAHVEHVECRLGEQDRLRFGQYRAQQRGSQHHAGDHLAHHLGLAQALGELSDQAAGHDDQARLQEEVDRKL